jgi:hypothetical protein
MKQKLFVVYALWDIKINTKENLKKLEIVSFGKNKLIVDLFFLFLYNKNVNELKE